jgi:hypothetical protein
LQATPNPSTYSSVLGNIGNTVSAALGAAIVGQPAEAEQTSLSPAAAQQFLNSYNQLDPSQQTLSPDQLQKLQQLAGQPPSDSKGPGYGTNRNDPSATPTPSPSPTPEDAPQYTRLRDLPPEQAAQYLSDHGDSLTPDKQLQLSGPLLDAYDKGLLNQAQVDQLKSFVANVPNSLDNGLTPSQNVTLANLRSNTAPASPAPQPPAATASPNNGNDKLNPNSPEGQNTVFPVLDPNKPRPAPPPPTNADWNDMGRGVGQAQNNNSNDPQGQLQYQLQQQRATQQWMKNHPPQN